MTTSEQTNVGQDLMQKPKHVYIPDQKGAYIYREREKKNKNKNKQHSLFYGGCKMRSKLQHKDKIQNWQYRMNIKPTYYYLLWVVKYALATTAQKVFKLLPVIIQEWYIDITPHRNKIGKNKVP